jgi:TonB family protein
LIHFDFDDRYQDEAIVGSALNAPVRIALGLLQALLVLGVLMMPRLGVFEPSAEELEAQRERLRQLQERQREEQRFVFVAPRVDLEALQPKPTAPLSDLDRRAQAPQRAEQPKNPLPFSRGNSFERTESAEDERKQGPETEVPPNEQPPRPQPEEQIARTLPPADTGVRRSPELSRPARGALGDALRNLQKYVENQTFHNPQGGVTDPGQTIQFDTKGVDFGPWVRRFVAQVKRNWFVPDAAMTFRGHVVIQFNIHKNGRITDINVVGPSNIDAFNRAAFNAIVGSNPVEPLPPEYPEPVAFFTVTFYYNEQPPLN